MNDSKPKFELPQRIERVLAALSKLYAQEGQRQKQEIVVNAQARVHEAWSSDNWNGGTYGHALYLALPESLYLAAVRQKDDIQSQIKSDINKIHNVQNEFVEEVFLEMAADGEGDWRRDSGVLRSARRQVPVDAATRIWGDIGYRVFLSHKAEVKQQTATLRAGLKVYGVSCFVAHVDILPTKEWQDEIETALCSMDAFVALMTDTFHASDWTDQEVGFAFGRGVPIIAVKLGRDPYGFLGRFQALSCDWAGAPKELMKLLIRFPRMLDSYIAAVRNCASFDNGNTLSEVLPDIDRLAEGQADQLVQAFNDNPQVHDSFGFNGTKPFHYGPGLAHHLSRATGRMYAVDCRSNRIGITP